MISNLKNLFLMASSWRYSMPSMEHLYGWSVFRAESQNHEKSITVLELFELNGFKRYFVKGNV